jgi:DNA mismatch repair protein MutS
VANDFTLGAGGAPDGILLFGTNAVGKTSIIRALGIAIILAQCGMFVPCHRFVYSPYTAIYSRILGNDNIFKGLSTFAVEMTELRMILNTADANSLILGDELCSGTETESALSIFMAGLMDLHAKRASFFFATHFHEMLRFDEMRTLPRVALKHMSVWYDRERDCLVYDRKLADGAGNRMYGLEVCKSLHLPQTFLEQAYQIRTKYFPDTKGELEHTETKYHSAKIKGLCEICLTNIGQDVHHLQEQHLANENGYIGHFHKNHPANLMVLCESCHHKIHNIGSPTSVKTEDKEAIEKPKRTYRKKTTAGKMIV